MSLRTVRSGTDLLLVTRNEFTAARLLPSFRAAGFNVVHRHCGEPALAELEQRAYPLVLLCACAPGTLGLNTLLRGRAIVPQARFIILTEYGQVDTAVEAMRLGAYDYVAEPIDLQELHLRVARALEDRELRIEVARLRSEVNGADGRLLVGRSPAMLTLLEQVTRVAPLNVPVLLTGETGVGKELVARRIHAQSRRAALPFMTISCAALCEALLESELFGHVRGSFTGATTSSRGLVEEAAGGTVFLDEVETLSPALQAKLLRVVEERTIQRVGGRHDLPIDFRLVAASNTPLEPMVARGAFRGDLLFRLNVFPIHVLPLRERLSDVPLLAAHFRDQFARETGLPVAPFADESMAAMLHYEWPGNVRELRHCVERAMILRRGEEPLRVGLGNGSAGPVHAAFDRAVAEGWTLARLEREYVRAVLDSAGGNRSRAARVLGINRSTLYEKLERGHDTGATGWHRSRPGAETVGK